ncbi:hypothetical protein BGZ95_006514, partial [Linnemannia exigua]
MDDSLSSITNSCIRGAKQTAASASGGAQKFQTDAAQKVADAQTHAEGIIHEVQGQAQRTVGSTVRSASVELSGQGNFALAGQGDFALSLRTISSDKET